MKTVAIITAGGSGKRMGRPKQFIEINGKTVLEWTLSAFEAAQCVHAIILVVNAEDIERAKRFKFSKLKQIVAGGEERQFSVYNGLQALPEDAEIVAVHDGARPFVTVDIIERAVAEAEKSGAAVVGVPVCDTIKTVTSNKRQVTSTLDRRELWAAQTPQAFKREIIVKAYEKSWDGSLVTDDSTLVEKLGVPVTMVMGSDRNNKITTPHDLQIAEVILSKGERTCL